MRKLTAALILALWVFILPANALANEDVLPEDDEAIYTLVDLNGTKLASHAGRICVDDEYISADNQLYVVVQVDDTARRARAVCMGEEPPVNADKAREVFAFAEDAKKRKLICMYSTHSDESYEPTDGNSSMKNGAGIYDVDEALKRELEKLGIEVRLDETSHLPHDAKAYSRSRRTAEELLKASPDALLDIHRDGIPDESEYETKVDGKEVSRVRLLVGRSNPNASVNREFAKQLKAAADEKYDGLIKDIFIGKGNYNQELTPKSLLLEFGTHTVDKERVLRSTPMMADVLNTVLYGDAAQASPLEKVSDEESKAGGKSALWLIIIVALGGLIYALVSSGTLRGLGGRISRAASEVTGGALNRRKDDDR